MRLCGSNSAWYMAGSYEKGASVITIPARASAGRASPAHSHGATASGYDATKMHRLPCAELTPPGPEEGIQAEKLSLYTVHSPQCEGSVKYYPRQLSCEYRALIVPSNQEHSFVINKLSARRNRKSGNLDDRGQS